MEKFINASGSSSWRILGTKLDGTRIRRNFKLKAEAIEMLSDLQAEFDGAPVQRRPRRTSLTEEELSDAEAALRNVEGRQLSRIVSHYVSLEERAKEKGLSLDAAMGFVESRYRSELQEISVLNARDEFVNQRKKGGKRKKLSPKTVAFYEYGTKLLLPPDPNRPLHLIEVRDIEGVLERFENPNSEATYRRAFSVFFNWAVRRHYCLENPCDRLDRADTPITTISILSLKEVKRLLQAAVEYKDGIMVPVVAIALFGGLRPSEITDLKLEDVSGERIWVEGGKMRRKLQRNVPLSSNLMAWLESFPFAEVPASMTYRMKVLREATKAANWVQDILRHTSISYQAERDKNEGLTAFNTGTSKAMMDRYDRKGIRDPKAVDLFWSITPASLKKEKIKVKLPWHQDTDWPSKGRLKMLVWEKPMTHIAKEIGVSDVALKKHCVKLGLELPPMGYWLREGR